MPITRTEILDVLGDPRLVNMRFSVGPINVNAAEYNRVADYIKAGAIDVETGKSTTRDEYIPRKNMIRTRVADPPLTSTMRVGLLHECTHAITDINKCNVSRMTDEAAAFLAQILYLKFLEPSLEKPPIGTPVNNMMRLGMSLVDKYHLGKPAGMSAVIDQGDVQSLAHAVHAIPQYNSIDEDEMLDADDVDLTDDQAAKFAQLQVYRMMIQDMSNRMNEAEAQRITMRSRSVAYENYVTDDQELLALLQAFVRGGTKDKEAALRKLFHIFLTISQPSALNYSARLSAAAKGDLLSVRFHASFPAPVIANLLTVLRSPR